MGIYCNMLDSEKTTTTTTTARPIVSIAAISSLKFPFKLTKDQLEAVDAWVLNGYRGSIIYSTGTGKTEIAFECAKRGAAAIAIPAAHQKGKNFFNILLLVPRIILVEQNIGRLLKYGISKEHIGAYFGERKEVHEITVGTYQSVVNNSD